MQNKTFEVISQIATMVNLELTPMAFALDIAS